MELDIDTLLKGKACNIKDKGYYSAEAYITPFLERMSKYTSNFVAQAKLPDCLSIDSQKGEDIWYSRVWVQAVLPDEYNNHQDVIGMIYALDTRVPVVKIYKGALNMACLNLCIFQPDFLDVKELEPYKAINYKPVEDIMRKTSEINTWLEKLKNTEVPYNKSLIDENLGQWVRNALNKSYDNGHGKVKLATSTAIDAYKLLYEDKKSSYYVKPGDSTDMFTVYNAFTELITNDGNKEAKYVAKDLITKPEKTLLLKEILSI